MKNNVCNDMNSSESLVADKFMLHVVSLMTDINKLLDHQYICYSIK